MRAAPMPRPGAPTLRGHEAVALAATAWACAAVAAGVLDERAQMALATLVVSASLPHGAADLPVARALLAPRLGSGWLPVFIGSYLALAGAVLLFWWAAPAAALAGFLAVAAVHFGLTDAREGEPALTAVVARGGAPLVVPALAHPNTLAELFLILAGDGGAALVDWLRGPLALAWLMAVLWTLRTSGRPAAELLLVCAAFALLPPLLAFALYFGLLHAPRALREAATRMRIGIPALLRASAAPTAAALAMLVGGYAALRSGLGPTDAVLSAMFIGLAALTAPHMALELLIAKASRRSDR